MSGLEATQPASQKKIISDEEMSQLESGAKPSSLESGFRGAMQGLSADLLDEGGGLLEAVGSKVGLRGLGSPNLSDIRLESDDEDQQDFQSVYEQARDNRRAINREAKEMEETINELRQELNEVNLLNAKLLYTNKIFKAKNLTESQKVKVLAAFDKAASVNEASFGVKGIGYKTDVIGGGEPVAPKGKWKASGYGDLPKKK